MTQDEIKLQELEDRYSKLTESYKMIKENLLNRINKYK